MDYSVHMVARAEHQRMVRSVPPVSEFGEHIVAAQPHFLARQTARLLSALKHGFAVTRNPMRPRHDRALNVPLTE
jgi:hypothetical protein